MIPDYDPSTEDPEGVAVWQYLFDQERMRVMPVDEYRLTGSE